jgi:hypothetical protein
MLGVLLTSTLLACSQSLLPEDPPFAPEQPVPLDVAALPLFTLDGCSPPTEEDLARGRCDPVNLVFPGKSVVDVELALRQAGWTGWGIGSVQFVRVDGTPELQRQQLQLFKPDQDSSNGLSRYHIRLWELPGPITIGAVHHETALPLHRLDSDWEQAEQAVRDDLCPIASACEESAVLQAQLAVQGDDEIWRGLRNDARMTVILLGGLP